MAKRDTTGDPQALTLLPTGMRLGRRGEALEVITMKSGEARLLAAERGVEFSEIVLKRGEQLGLMPFEEGTQGIEVCYLLSGEVRILDYPPLRVGDHLVLNGLEEPVLVTAESEATLLYLSSQPTFDELKQSMSSLMALAVEVEEQDGYTAGHCLRIQQLSVGTGRAYGLDSTSLTLLATAAYLHDIGKAKVPVQILQKPGSLTDEEWDEMRKHATYGREMLEQTPWQEAGLIVEQHHERMDGSGYPQGLRGDDIRAEAYIIAVADMYDAMTTDRPYRKALGRDAALAEVRRFAGVHFPEEIATAFFHALEQGDAVSLDRE